MSDLLTVRLSVCLVVLILDFPNAEIKANVSFSAHTNVITSLFHMTYINSPSLYIT